MEQKDIDIYEILKDKPKGTKLYTPLVGKVEFTSVATNKEAGEAIWTENRNGEFSFDKNGRWLDGGEVLLFPSNEMRDWRKFFKKGDVLVHRNGDVHVIFEGFKDNCYARFNCKHYLWKECFEDYSEEKSEMITFLFNKVSDDEAQTYINTLEKHFGGKLNRETLEIEKLKPKEKPAFEIGKLYVYREEDEDGVLTTIGNLIGKDESRDTLTFGNQYEIETEKFFACKGFGLRISLHKELREATEDEVILFQNAFTLWKKEKEAKEQPAFKPFDKVLVRNRGDQKWMPAFFVRDRGEETGWRYNVLPIHSGKSADFINCIPFEGNENIAFTTYDFVDLPF